MERHQEIYDDYADASTLNLTIDGVSSVDNGDGTFTSTLTFSVEQDGIPYLNETNLEQLRFGWSNYYGSAGKFPKGGYFNDAIAKTGTPGQFTATENSVPFAPELTNGQVYGYVADGLLDTEGMKLYGDVANAGLAFGDGASYESAANVSGCEKCHGVPYMKHGYRAAAVDGLADFAACKICHYDTRNGGHGDWQMLVDDPERYAEIAALGRFRNHATDEEKAKYAYTANVMNDTHMSHAMEFPYPQSMSTCVTCHEGKLDMILTDANFKIETCKSCHPVTGPEEGTNRLRAPALAAILPGFHDDMDLETEDCAACHSAEADFAPVFSAIHTGYDTEIYADADGTKYSEVFTASVDDASLDGNILTMKFSATKNAEITALNAADIIPTVMVALYGYDTKDFIVAAHGRDEDRKRLLEYKVNGEEVNPRFTTVSAADGNWEITADLSMWADVIADGSIKRAELCVMPALDDADGDEVALNAPSRTFDLVANAFDDGFYSDIVDVENGCNTCHDALATTFHSGKRGGNMKVCRACHVTLTRGSHLEMQSRSIDSYVHAIHSFQAYDIGDVNFADPVEAIEYEHHVGHVYPNFTIKNCESCHVDGSYDVPDQSKSLPGAMSASDTVDTWDRNIGNVPLSITGPGSRACGSCHRATLINEDEAGELISLNQHTKQGGYLIEGGDDYPSVLDGVIDYIMGLFK
ncbi:MAG: hypothetical protein GY809_29900 [Planctomycetes bacterium]|nr:hypothetical protein [Planctomycetota bacterium]